MSVSHAAPIREAACPVHSWCAVPHDIDPVEAEHFSATVHVGLPGGRELFAVSLADPHDDLGPVATPCGTDDADITADQFADVIGQIEDALPRLRAMHKALTATRHKAGQGL